MDNDPQHTAKAVDKDNSVNVDWPGHEPNRASAERSESGSLSWRGSAENGRESPNPGMQSLSFWSYPRRLEALPKEL